MYPQQTGWQQQPQQPLYGQQTGFQQPQPQQQGGFARPPLPPQASGQYSFLSAPPPSSSGLSPQQTGWQQQQQQPLRQQATGWAGAGIVPQATGWQGAGQQQPLMPQATGWHDPRLQMMQSSFMPMNTAAVSLLRLFSSRLAASTCRWDGGSRILHLPYDAGRTGRFRRHARDEMAGLPTTGRHNMLTTRVD